MAFLKCLDRLEVNVKTRPLLLCGAAAVALASIVLAQTGATAEQASIDELVFINRMLASSEMGVLGPYGHVSVRNRINPSHYLISRSVSPGLVTASDIYESD